VVRLGQVEHQADVEARFRSTPGQPFLHARRRRDRPKPRRALPLSCAGRAASRERRARTLRDPRRAVVSTVVRRERSFPSLPRSPMQLTNASLSAGFLRLRPLFGGRGQRSRAARRSCASTPSDATSDRTRRRALPPHRQARIATASSAAYIVTERALTAQGDGVAAVRAHAAAHSLVVGGATERPRRGHVRSLSLVLHERASQAARLATRTRMKGGAAKRAKHSTPRASPCSPASARSCACRCG
jgi:hypothetical protein